jgi:hypothetical protein
MRLASSGRWPAMWLCFLGVLAGTVHAVPQLPSVPQPAEKLNISIVDENGVAVPQALVLLTNADKKARCDTDFAGRCQLTSLASGTYQLHIEKLGFYRLDLPEVHVPNTASLDVTLSHEQEVRETVDVVESPPAIEPQKTADTETLSQREILNVPYPTTRDIRNALPLLPGVIMDQSGQLHVGGASRTQTLSLLDGFDVSQPVAGFLEMRINADAVRTVDVEAGRYSAQYGRGDSLLGMNTGIGNDRYVFTATNFVPSFQTRKGVHFDQWVPRATLSGPIKRGKIWFYVAPELEYNQDIINELPEGQDRATSWRTGNLLKLQANFTSANIFTAEFLVNNYHAPHAGLSALVPLPSTIDQRGNVYVGALKDQHYFKSGTLLELGFAADDFTGRQQPVGSNPYVLTPEGAQGSFYSATRGSARREQWIANVYLPPGQWHGRHEFRVGADLDRLSYHRSFQRAPISLVREDDTLARLITFTSFARATDNNFQTGLYFQDRWTPTDRLLVEGGVRTDWDEIIRTPVTAPRLGATYMLDRNGDTKLSAGAGFFYLATNLDVVSRPRTGQRLDSFYSADGLTQLGPATVTEFFVNEEPLRQPRSTNLSAGLERKLPRAVYLRADFLRKRVSDIFLFVPLGGSAQLVGPYLLTNGRQDHYDAFTITIRHSFSNTYPMMISYTRSSARTNALLDYSVDNIALGPQQGGRLPWDSPNRIIGWGWFPFVKKLDVGYSLEWRDGFPFTALDQQAQIVGQADSFRFPRYFTVALAAERRFHFRTLYLAIRATAENVTGRENPIFVNNNVDSPHFLTFSGLGHRNFSGRIRFLGRKRSKP